MADYDRWDESRRPYGAGDYEQQRWGRDEARRREAEGRSWRTYDPGHDSPDWRDNSGPRWRFSEGSGSHEARRYDPRGHGADRGFWDRAADQVAAWMGDEAAEARREADGRHRGRGPRGYRRADHRISDDIHDHLTEDAWLDASDIEVRVHDGEVELRGQVRTHEDRRRALEIADRVAGVTHVHDELRVHQERRSDWTNSGLYPY